MTPPVLATASILSSSATIPSPSSPLSVPTAPASSPPRPPPPPAPSLPSYEAAASSPASYDANSLSWACLPPVTVTSLRAPSPIPPAPVLSDDANRIPAALRHLVAVGVRGGLVFTPAAMAADADHADARLRAAFETVVAASLMRGGDEHLGLEDGMAAVHLGDVAADANDEAPAAPVESSAESPAESATEAPTDAPAELPKFHWKTSHSRHSVLDFGDRVRAQRAVLAQAARTGAAAARATATAASISTEGERPPAIARRLSARDDPVRWIAQEEAAVGQALRAVRGLSQRRARRGGGGGSHAAARGPAEDTGIWSFLMPKSPKLRPEAAAEMARAKVAAAEAVRTMRDGNKNRLSLPASGSGATQAAANGRRPRSVDASAVQPEDSDVSRTATGGNDGASEASEAETASEARSVEFGLSAYPDRDESCDALLLPSLDDVHFLARHRRASNNRDSNPSISPMKTPGFPRGLSLDATPRTPPKKKRVSFNSENNTIHPI